MKRLKNCFAFSVFLMMTFFALPSFGQGAGNAVEDYSIGKTPAEMSTVIMDRQINAQEFNALHSSSDPSDDAVIPGVNNVVQISSSTSDQELLATLLALKQNLITRKLSLESQFPNASGKMASSISSIQTTIDHVQSLIDNLNQ